MNFAFAADKTMGATPITSVTRDPTEAPHDNLLFSTLSQLLAVRRSLGGQEKVYYDRHLQHNRGHIRDIKDLPILEDGRGKDQDRGDEHIVIAKPLTCWV